MVALFEIFQPTELRPPATVEAVARAEQQLGYALPKQLRDFYSQSNGLIGNWTVKIFDVESLFERNETYEVPEYLPHLIYIGNDNGNEGLFIPRTSSDLTVLSSDLGDQSIDGLATLAPSLSDWFQLRCPWSDGYLGAPWRNK